MRRRAIAAAMDRRLGRPRGVRGRAGGEFRTNTRNNPSSTVESAMTGLMQGKRGLIMGVANDHSIAWGIAKALSAHGATLAFTYQGEALGKRVKPLAESLGATLILPCDVEDLATVDSVFGELETQWGGL